MSLTGPVQGLFFGALSGISQAAGILIGKRLGENAYDEAYREAKKLCWYGLIGAVALSVVLVLFKGLYIGHSFRINYINLFFSAPGSASSHHAEGSRLYLSATGRIG